MRFSSPFVCLALLAAFAALPAAALPPDCGTVRFADVGWTDIRVTTAVTGRLLEGLGMKSKVLTLSVPVTYASLKNGDVDVFLGNWMPTMAADIKPYAAQVDVVRPILQGARYTLAVPRAVAQAGVTTFADLAAHKERFEGRVYGIEPGNDGNRLLQGMIDQGAFGLKGWKLVESSEPAMLLQVARAVKDRKWIVFLAWEPHPMNQRFALTYLEGGDSVFGPKQGASTVFINTRKDYAQQCPVVGALLRNLEMTLADESELMALVLDDKLEPEKAADQWLKRHPEKLEAWLKGTQSTTGAPGLAAVRQSLGLR